MQIQKYKHKNKDNKDKPITKRYLQYLSVQTYSITHRYFVMIKKQKY